RRSSDLGGGFPGIPLAILFPECSFHLVDSIAKKLKVVDEVVEGLGLENVKTTNKRVEDIHGTYDFIVSRAVAAMPTFVHWVKGKIDRKSTRLNSSHVKISYAVFCLKKKNK